MLDGLFNLDSRAVRSFKFLLIKPGLLSAIYVEGIRKPYMKPIQIFLITNVLFFLLLPSADILRTPSKYFFNEDRQIELEQAMAKHDRTREQILLYYDRVSADISKGFIIVILPILALILMLLYFRSDMFFGMHLIFAMHYVSFFFISCLCAVMFAPFGNTAVQIFIISINYLYATVALKKFYCSKWFWAIAKGLLFLIAFAIITHYYRVIISYLSFKFIAN